MKYSILLLLSFNIIVAVSYGQDSVKLMRISYKLVVAVDKLTSYEENLKTQPYILPDNTVQIYPGETIYVEVEQEDGAIKSMTAVKENANPGKTLILAFSQTTKNHVHESMTLKVTNPFSQALIYKAKMFLFKNNKWADTDVYPVEPGLFGIEIWPDIIISLGLGNWAFQKS